MLELSNEMIMDNAMPYLNAIKKSIESDFTVKKFLNKTMPVLGNKSSIKYPLVIKLPKSSEEMLKGDFSPSRVITINEPIMYDNFPIWFGDCLTNVPLRFGYFNGDSRLVCDLGFTGSVVHGMIAGATGQGKSVALAATIAALVHEFGPWALRLMFADPKLVELGPYATDNRIPHVDIVAATEDTDYTVSALLNMVTRMNKRNNILQKAQVANIGDFWKKTGLTLPQNVLIIDEMETLLLRSAKKLDLVVNAMDQIVKLGRATGFHIVMASQNVPSDIPAGLLNNISFRAALGCVESVSVTLLGNAEAKSNVGKPGKLIVNLNSSDGAESIKSNRHVVVPYADPSYINFYTNKLMEKARDLSLTYPINYYNDTEYQYDNRFDLWIDKMNFKSKNILLGESSYVNNDIYGITRLKLNREDIENILIMSKNKFELERLIFPVVKGFSRFKETNLIASLDKGVIRNIDYSILDPAIVSDDDSYYRNESISKFIFTIKARTLALQIESKMYSGSMPTLSDDYYAQYAEMLTKPDYQAISQTHLNKDRFTWGIYLLDSDPMLKKQMGIDDQNQYVEMVVDCIALVSAYGFSDRQFGAEDFKPVNLWLLGIDKLIGVGRLENHSTKSSFFDNLQSAYSTNCRLIASCSGNLSDLPELVKMTRWFITSLVDQKDINRFCPDDFPDTVLEQQAVLTDALTSGEKCVKYKKVVFEKPVELEES